MSKEVSIRVPVVCTRGVVVFPGQDVMIEVGRQKSINAVNEASASYDSMVWIVCQNDIMVDNPSEQNLYRVGTLSKIKIVRRKEGFMRVTFTGMKRAELLNLEDSNDMMMATIQPLEEVEGNHMEEMALVKRIISEFEKVSNLSSAFPSDIVSQLSKGVSAITLTDQFAQYFPLDTAAKQKLLETVDVNERMVMIIAELEKQQRFSQIEANINDKVKERIDESQKEYFLREKLKAIKEELGDVSNVTDDTTQLREMIEKNPYPDHVKQKAREELQRYEMLPPGSGEASVERTYLDWLLKVPWWQETEDSSDLKEVRKVLDEDHYGLDKVKDRIMEYLAVKEMTGNLNAPILCLVGPPGVGKTSLAKSISRALDRKFVKMSLGGVRDEAEIRGHRRTYLGALPGRVIQGMKRAQVINPVFLIDEIDKMGADYKGDPSDALLEVLDPEQNQFFSDHYLEEPYDLSKVMFIATANYLDNIPAPLQDRLEIIELPSYTEVDKVHIAVEHLIPKQIKANGLKPAQFHLKEKEILYLIRHYTREAGVRQLERVIASLCRKTVLAILKDGKKSVTITEKLIHEWLGKDIFDYGVKEKQNRVGVVTGLAYTSFGGDVLQIEVNFFDGKGALVLTGKLGDVMKESAEIALDYVKAHAKELKIDPSFFSKHDIHIHVPEGAVPKDGPSAGVTLTTALVSALTNTPVYSDLAMTGEVTLRGNVLPIGGLREKSLAANRAGISKIIFPKGNVRDLDEVPAAVREKMTYVPVENMSQVLKEAMVR
ncbi:MULTISPECIES: endopeptidase La [Erysipelotrichaceae]|jgi:ATP-dependent Lon protease|uniref:endopeptidase La n=1 Tax=Erysipelotrichaceae TaxID=128827 RepID=UPI000CF9E4FB|nr:MULTISPECIES: endopeptidase La [Erysipelotrichaceae]MCI2155062.1 endopeptidase La [Solobacterium sp.]MCI6746102.1 endopeptidase La [Anaerolactibacter massiliensis]MDD5881445.1 endopeptidase La [Stecheria intestinalis]MDD6367158.1 endopeptidase La [Stecheria intestinalis]MDD7679756.1 endopeptidase La [Stecheria intestinalis]